MGSLFTKKKKPVKKDWIKIELDVDFKKPFDVQQACRNVDIYTTSQLHPDDRLKEGVYVEEDDIKEGMIMAKPTIDQQKQELLKTTEARKVAAFRTAYTSVGAQLMLKEKVMKQFASEFDHEYDRAKGSLDHFIVMFKFKGDREKEWLEKYIEEKKRWWIVSLHDGYKTWTEYKFYPKELTQI